MAKVNTKTSIKGKSGSADKNFSITSGKVLSNDEVKRLTGNPEDFKKLVKSYVNNKNNANNIAIYVSNNHYYIVVGNAYKKEVAEAVKAGGKNKLELCKGSVADIINGLSSKFGSMDICKEKNSLYLENKIKGLTILIDENLKNKALEKSKGINIE